MPIQSLVEDIRYGGRLIRRSPGFAAVIIATLAVGIGANTAIFSILNALLLRDLPVWRPDRLVEVSAIYRNGAKVPFSFPMFQELQRNQRLFSNLFGWSAPLETTLELGGKFFPCTVRGVTGDFYSTLGATPLLGRLIGPTDATGVPAAPVAVIGYEFWNHRFARDPAVVGRTIRIGGTPFTIIGVTRQWFMGTTPGEATELTVPITAGLFAERTNERALLWMFVGGRLKDGIEISAAHDQLQSLWRDALVASAPTTTSGPRLQSWMGIGLQVSSAAKGTNADLRSNLQRPLRILMGLAALILIAACLNLANLTLSRVAARAHEIGVRVALGATRFQVARQLLSQTLLLCAVGALLALGLATWGGHLLLATITAPDPVLLDLRPDWRVFCFLSLVATGTGVLIAFLPGWHAWRQRPNDLLQAHQRTTAGGSGRLSRILVVAQIALSLVLVFGAGLLVTSFEKLRTFDPHFQRKNVLQLALNPRPYAFKAIDINIYRKQLIDDVTRVPGVLAASFANLEIPAGDMGWRDTVTSAPSESPAEPSSLATLAVVSPEFFETLGIPIVSGRSFDWSDDEKHPPVAIVDEHLLKRLFPSGDALGKRIRFGVRPELANLQIVGVARSASLINVRDSSSPILYAPSTQFPDYQGNLLVRSENSAGIVRTVENAIQSHGQEYATSAKTLEETGKEMFLEDRGTATLASLFAGLALLLAGIGLFSLMSYSVTRRTREIGIRIAVGAQRGTILRLILRESLMLSAVGILLGIPCALALTRLIAHVLFGVSTADPLTFGVAAAMLLLLGAAAGYWPARRAATLAPTTALRWE